MIYRVFQNKVTTLNLPVKIRDSTCQVETYLEYVFYWLDLCIKILSVNSKYKKIKTTYALCFKWVSFFVSISFMLGVEA